MLIIAPIYTLHFISSFRNGNSVMTKMFKHETKHQTWVDGLHKGVGPITIFLLGQVKYFEMVYSGTTSHVRLK